MLDLVDLTDVFSRLRYNNDAVASDDDNRPKYTHSSVMPILV